MYHEKSKSPTEATAVRKTLQGCCVLPMVFFMVIRAGDVLWYNATLCEAVGPTVVIGVFFALCTALVTWSTRHVHNLLPEYLFSSAGVNTL